MAAYTTHYYHDDQFPYVEGSKKEGKKTQIDSRQSKGNMLPSSFTLLYHVPLAFAHGLSTPFLRLICLPTYLPTSLFTLPRPLLTLILALIIPLPITLMCGTPD